MMSSSKRTAVALLVGTAAVWLGLDAGLPARFSSSGANMLNHPLVAALRNEPFVKTSAAAHPALGPMWPAPLDTLLAGKQWINTQPLRPEDLRGKVVLVDFWTFTCVNWLRTLPYVRAWADKYKDRGLVVIGVHTPEFSIEKDFANVTRASAALGVDYPVVIDNDYVIWRAFGNHAWPALYFIDADGRVRHHVVGEGGYAQSERMIQQFLFEAGGAMPTRDLVSVNPKGPEVAADLEDLGSPETYVGYAQAVNFVPVGGVRKDAPSLYRVPAMLPLNWWGLAGVWTIEGESAVLNDSPGSISYRFHARDVNLVLAAPEGRAVRLRVKIDGAPPGADHGTDVDAEGFGSVQQPRLYQLVRQPRPIEDRTFEIEFLDPGVRAFVFTFG